jgi:hypothetical protein
MFCPSKAPLNAWIAASLADVAARYDIDGWFLDHARYTSPAHGGTLLACGCGDCEAAARERGVELDAVRDDLRALYDDIRSSDHPGRLLVLAEAGPVAIAGWLAMRPGVLDWFDVRARILADRFGAIGAAIQAASPKPVEFGSDVFPPGVALLAGHVYSQWAEAGATYLTGGFTPNIGWGSVGRITATSLGSWLAAQVPDLSETFGAGIVGELIGAEPSLSPDEDLEAYLAEVSRMAATRGTLPVYPPIAGSPDPETLARMCHGIVDAGLDGAMLGALETSTPEQRRAIRDNLSKALL